MQRHKTQTRPGLVALYDIRPGNGAGQFLQPRSPHGAIWNEELFLRITCCGGDEAVTQQRDRKSIRCKYARLSVSKLALFDG